MSPLPGVLPWAVVIVGPDEGIGVLIVVGDEAVDVGDQI
jgi:hypothetical protein